jgi:hypothetical protein
VWFMRIVDSSGSKLVTEKEGLERVCVAIFGSNPGRDALPLLA